MSNQYVSGVKYLGEYDRSYLWVVNQENENVVCYFYINFTVLVF